MSEKIGRPRVTIREELDDSTSFDDAFGSG
jgi:hypothetical protein